MTAQAQIIDISVYDNSATDNAIWTAQRNLAIGDVDLGRTIGTSFNVAQIASVSNCCIGCAVLFFMWIEMWSGRCASIGVVAKLMDMEAVLSCCQAGYLTGNRNWAIFRLLN